MTRPTFASIGERAFDEAGLEALKKFMNRREIVVMTLRRPVGVSQLTKAEHCTRRMNAVGSYGFEHRRHALPEDEVSVRLSCTCGGFVICRAHVGAPWVVEKDGESFA